MRTEIKDKDLHRIVATAFIYKPDRTYLVTRRAMHKKVMPGKWTVPGGGLTADDYINTKPSTASNQWYGALENTLRREVKEEVNLEIGKPEYLLDYTFIRPEGIPVLGLTFMAPYVSGEVVLDEDATEFAWIKAEDASKYDFIEGIEWELEKVEEVLRDKGLGSK